MQTKKADYGIDAPGVIRNMFIVAFICLVLAFVVAFIRIPSVSIPALTFICPGISFLLGGSLMMLYSTIGKYKYRERLLNMVEWKGDEQVLDIGTGKGLLMVGAAKRLTTGKAYGIDIWNEQDLSGNNSANALDNASIEGVGDRVEVQIQNATEMNFADATFDVVLSNLCLHNIYNKAGRDKACREIYRVLKPGGIAIISDFKHTAEYNAVFKALGMKTAAPKTDYLNTFPPLTVIKAVK